MRNRRSIESGGHNLLGQANIRAIHILHRTYSIRLTGSANLGVKQPAEAMRLGPASAYGPSKAGKTIER